MEDVDSVFQRAVDAGAEVVVPVDDQFWGDRDGKLTNPFGHHWSIGSRIEDLSPAQVQERAAEFFSE